MNGLSGKVALVTGSTRGIGHAIARAFLGEGMTVIVSGRATERVNRVASEFNARFPGQAWSIPADLSDPEEIAMLAAQAETLTSRIDVLVNNAGVGRFAPVPELSADAWRETMEVNAFAPFYLTKLLLPRMIERGSGYVINIGSLAGRHPFAGGAAYCASKFALLAFSECLMLDVRRHGVKVTCIMPGSVATEFGGAGKREEEWRQHPEDIAQVCLDLLRGREGVLVSRVEMRPLNPPEK